MPDAVISVWEQIWGDSTLPKNYTFDYEVYGEKAQNGDQSEAEVFVGIN
jgi:predicted transcriptional regulator YdeE